MYNDELYHHGVKGQRWGVRRYQNPDGSLTQEGYQHWGLNPDGSRFRRSRREFYTDHTKKRAVQGMAIGTAVGAAAGAAGGAVGVAAGAYIGNLGGAAIGTVVGGVQSAMTRKKIKKLLDETGKVYVKDL